MWYLKVSSSLLIAVALICMIQNAISLTLDQTTEDQWSKLASSTDQIDLKKILKLCKNSINSFNEKLENTKTIVNKKLPEPNKTTEDLENLVSDVKTQIKNSSADLVTVRKLVQKTALRFRDTFKSLASFTELDNESVNKELEGIKKTTVDGKKPLVNRVVRSFGNRYDLNKLANKVLEISADREKLKNNYDEKKKIAKKELNSLWNSLTNHSKTVNDNALKAFETFFEGMKSLKSVKKIVKTIGEDAINEIKKGDDFNNLKNAVELAKALKLKFEDEWNLESGELTYSEEQKKDATKTMDENPVEDNEYDNSINDIEPSLPTTKQETIDNEKINSIPSTQVEIEKTSKDDSLASDKTVSEVEETQLPTESENKVQSTKLRPTIKDDLADDNISDNKNSPIEETSKIPNTENTENKEKTILVEPKVSNNETNSTNGIKSGLSNNETKFNPDVTNDETPILPNKNAVNNKKNKIINKRTSREKIPILPWQKLIQLDDPQVSQQSKNCESLLNNITPDFDNIKKSAKNSIQVTKNYKTLQKIENDTVQRFYDKMVDTNKKLSDYLVNSAEDVCAKVTPINKRYETKFKNDPNIKRIKYLLGKQYDPNQYILKILDDASQKNGIGGMKKTTYYKMLAVGHNLNHETKEMEDAALYAMNKIYEGKLAATNLKKMFNKEKASKACYIRNILLENENDAEKKNKDENKEKVKESINNDTTTEPLKPDVNLDSVDDIQPSTIKDDNEPTSNNEEEKETLNDTNESTTNNNLGNNENDNTSDEKDNIKKENEEQMTEENYSISSIPQNKDKDTATQKINNGAKTVKRNITRKITHHRKHRNPNDPNDVSEEYDTMEVIDDEEDVTNEYKSSEKESIIVPEEESLDIYDNKREVAESGHSEKKNSESFEEKSSHEKTTEENNSGEPKTKRHRKRKDPKDGKEISEEYDEEDEKQLNKSGEKTLADTEKPETPVTADNQIDAETPEHLENENVVSNEENSKSADTSDENNSGEPKTKRRRKRKDPKDGKEISVEYDEEDEKQLNKSGEKTLADTEKPEAPVTAYNQIDEETPEHLENENVASNEENSASADTSDENNSGEPKTKRHRKRKYPKDEKEISEEYDEEDEKQLNKSGEKTLADTEKPEAPVTADNQIDAETPEHLENENVVSNEENSKSADTSDENNSGEPKTKRRRKRKDPKDGKEISVEYDEEDEKQLNKSGEKTLADTEKPEAPVTAYNQIDEETPEHLENENVASNEENSASADTSDENNSGEPKTKRHRKRKYPKDEKEISEEYDEEDEKQLNKSGEKTLADTEKPEAPVTADNQIDAETPEHLENENVASNEENSTSADTSDENNSGEPKTKRHRKRKDPKDEKEISEEYDEEDEKQLNKSGEKTLADTEKPEAPVTADNQIDAETPEHLENENVASNEENSTSADTSDENNSGKPKTKRHRKRKDPKDGKEISEEYDEEDEKQLNKSGEKTLADTEKPEAPVTADNQIDAETPEHLENENVASNEENSTSANTSDENNSGEPKTKRHRKRKDPKDEKEISEEYDEEDEKQLNKSGEKTLADTEKPEAPVTADNQIDAETPEHLENENVASNEENSTSADTSDENNSGKPKTKRHRKRKDPKDGKEISEEYDEEDEKQLNKSGEKTLADTEKPEAPVTADNQIDAETPEHLENENVASNEENSTSADTSDENNSGEPKTKRHRKRKDPKGEKEISEEYDEEDEKQLNKSGEKTLADTEKPEAPVTADNQIDAETPEHLENENVASNEENSTSADTSDENNSGKPKTKRHRKRKDPKDGKEISEEYDEEDEKQLNKSGEKTLADTEKPEAPVTADNQIDAETPEHLENENVASNEENSTSADTSDENNSGEPKTKRHRKRKDPKDEKEISEEYDEEDEKQLNKSGEKTLADTEKPEAPVTADNQIDAETPEHLENENVASNEENSTSADTSDENNSGKPKTKRHRKRKDPKDGKEISEEYDEEDEKQLNKSGEKTLADTEKPEAPVTADNQIDAETPEHLENENVASNEENSTSADTSDENNSGKPKTKRHRKRKDPKDGKEISEEFDEEDEKQLNKSGEKTLADTEKPEAPVTADNQIDAETPEHLENENVASNEENSTSADTSDENNSGKPKTKRHRKRKDPKDGKEISEEYDEEDEKQLNKSGEKTLADTEKPEAPVTADNQIDAETPEHLENENVASNEENSTSADTSDENNSGEPKTKRHRKRKDPKDGKEISEEYDEEDEKQLNKSGEKTLADTEKPEAPVTADNQIDAETPEHLENENVASNEENSTSADTSDENNSGEPKTKRHRKRKDPKDEKEISEEYDEEVEKQLNKSGEKTLADTEKPEAPVTADNQVDAETPEHLENEYVVSNEENSTSADTSDENNSGEPKTKRRRKRKDPKDGKEISVEYDEEDEKQLNKSDEKTLADTEKPEAPVTAYNQIDAETPEHLENENVVSNEENSASDENYSGEPKTKRRRKRKDPKDGKEISEENDTFEEDENNLNKSIEKYSTDTSEIEPPANNENNSEQETEDEDTSVNITSVNEDSKNENLSKESKSFDDNDEKIDQENTTNETEDMDENENLSSVEDTELKCVNNDKVIPAAESMGEDSTSNESSYESPEQSQFGTSNKRPDNNETTDINKSNEYVDMEEPESKQVSTEIANIVKDKNSTVNKNPRRHKKGKDPKNGQEPSKEYDSAEVQEEDSTAYNKIVATPEKQEEKQIKNDSEKPDKYQPNANGREITTNKEAEKPSEIDEKDEEVNQPNRRNKTLKNPTNDIEMSEEYYTPVATEEELKKSKIDTPTKTPENTENDHNSEIPEHDENKNSSEIPEYNKNPEYNQSNEHDPESPAKEVADKPNEIDEQPVEVKKPTIKNRRQRRPKKPNNGYEVPEDYEINHKHNDESPESDNEIETPSETQENTEDEPNSDVNEFEVNPENNQSNEHDPESPANEVADQTSEINDQPKEVNQPSGRHRRRKDPKSGLEVSEEFDSLEEQDEESPFEDNKIDTPEYDENSELNLSNEHAPEIPTNEVTDKPNEIDEQPVEVKKPTIKNRRQRRPKKPNNGHEVPEDYETNHKHNDESPESDNEIETPSETQENTEDEPNSDVNEFEVNPENNQSNEHDPESPANEVADQTSEINDQPKEVNQPSGRHRRRKDPKSGLEVSEEFDSLEEQDEESPFEDNKIDTPEYDENSELNLSNENAPEIPTNEVTDIPNEIDVQPVEVKKPTIKNRRQRRPKKPNNGHEVPEDYETNHKHNDESPESDNEIETPSETQENTEDEPNSDVNEFEVNPENNQSNEHDPESPANEVADQTSEINDQPKEVNQPSGRHRRRKDPKSGLEVSEEFDSLEEQDEESPFEDNKIDTPEYDENSELNLSNENAPEIPTNEVTDIPNEIDVQPVEVKKPTIKNRRQRRPKKPNNGHEVPEDYETNHKHNDESPESDNEIETPSETQENTEDEPNSDVNEFEVNPENNQSNEHDPESPANEVAVQPSEIDNQPKGINQPNGRHKRRKDPKSGLEVSEEYDSLEEQDEESPLEDNKIDTPEYDENSELNLSNEHAPEIPTNEVTDKPNEIDEQPVKVKKPTIKNRRQRRPKKPNNGHEVPEDYETNHKHNDESPESDNEIETPSETQENTEDEPNIDVNEFEVNPENNQSNEHDPESPANEVANQTSEINDQPKEVNQPSRRHRRRKDPKSGLEVSEEFDSLEEQDEESPYEDNKIDTPEYDENSELNLSNENAPENQTNEVTDIPNEIDEQPVEVKKPTIKNRRQRRPKKPNNGHEVPEDYETNHKHNDESPESDNEIETPSETQENTEDELNSDVNEFEVNPENNQSNEHDPESPANEVAVQPRETDNQPKGINQPNGRHKRRKDPKSGLEVSEEYDSLEEQDEESPLEDNKIDTPEYDENSELNLSNEHAPEIPTNEVTDKPNEIDEQPVEVKKPTIKNRRQRRPKKPNNGHEVPEDYEINHKQNDESPESDNEIETPSETQENTEDEPNIDVNEFEVNPENNQSNEHDPESPANEVADQPSEIDNQPKGINQPSGRHRRRKDPKSGLEVSEEFDSLEEQDEESPYEDNKIDTPEYDENSELNLSNENAPENPTNEVTDIPNEIDEQPVEVKKPTIKNRRQRRPKKPNNGHEVPEDYETNHKHNDESPESDNEIETPSETQENTEDELNSDVNEFEVNPENNQSNEHDPESPANEVAVQPRETDNQPKGINQPNGRHKRRKDPKSGLEVSEEYDSLEEQDEESPLEDNKIDTPEYDENSELNLSNEHAPEIPTNEVTDKPNEIDEQPVEVKKPTIKNRRQRRPKKPNNGHEVPEDYETNHKHNDESPESDNEIETPSETQENTEDELNSDVNEFEVNPENNQSNEHDPESPANEVAVQPRETDNQPKGINQPNGRHKRRKDPKSGLEVSEEYDSLEEQDEESPLEDNKIDTPEYDENSELNLSNEHAPEIPTNEVTDKPNEIDEQPVEVKKPTIKNRRQRRPKKPNNGHEVPEDYEINHKQNDESPESDNEIETPSETQENTEDEPNIDVNEFEVNPENNQSNEHDPESPANEVADQPSEIDNQPKGINQPSGRHRRRKDPKSGLEVSEEFDSLEEQDEESPFEDNKIDTPEYDENSELNLSNDNAPEIPTNEVTDIPNEIDVQPVEVKKPTIKNRRQRRPKKPNNGHEVPEDYETNHKHNDESPESDNEIETPSETQENTEDEPNSDVNEFEVNPENNQSNEHDPESPANEVAVQPSEIDNQPKGINQPSGRHRRRKDPKSGLEVSEEYDSLEEQDEESPLEDNKIDTPEYDENSELNLSNEHAPEIPTNEVTDKPNEIDEQPVKVKKPTIKNRRQRRPKKPNNGHEVPEDYETNHKHNDESPESDNEIETPSETQENTEDEPNIDVNEFEVNPENNQSNEHDPESPANEVANQTSEINDQPKEVNQPSGRHRRRKDPKSGLEVSEEFDSLEEQDEESPYEDNKIDTPEYDENSELNLSNENAPENPTNEVTDIPNEIDEQPVEVKKPTIKNRRQRRPKKPNNGHEVPEDYETNHKHNDESPESDNEIETPSETQENTEDELNSDVNEFEVNPENNQSNEHDPESPANEVAVQPRETDNQPKGINQPNGRHKRRKDPKSGLEVSEEYDSLEEQDEESPLEDNKIDTPEYDENSELNLSNEHAPEIPTNEVTDKPNEIDEQPVEVKKPTIKNRRQRRPKKPNNGHEVPEDYEINHKQNDESPESDNEIETPSETQENTEDEPNIDVNEFEVNPENNQSNEHDPESPANEVADQTSEINDQPKEVNQPSGRHRRRKDPKSGLEVSEEYDSLEEQDEESPLEDNKIDTPEYDENSELNLSNEHAPEIPTNEVTDIPNEIDVQPVEVKKPTIKNRRQRRPKKPKNGHEVPEDYETDKHLNDEPQRRDIELDTPVYDENSEYNHSNDVVNDNDQPKLSEYPEISDLSSKDSETPIDTDYNNNVVKPHPRKIRRRKKSKQPQSVYDNDNTSIEVNDENINNYPVEDHDVNNNYIPSNNNDVHDDTPRIGYGETNDNDQPKLPEYPINSDLTSKDSETPLETDDNDIVVKPHPRKFRRRRKSKQPQSVYENDKTPIEVNDNNINNYPVEDHDVNNNYIPSNSNDVHDDTPRIGYGETNDNDQPKLPEYPINSDLSSKDSEPPLDTNDNENVVKPHPRKIRRRKKLKQPKSVNGNDNTPIEANDVNTKIIPTNADAENSSVLNEEKSTIIPDINPKNIQKNPKKKRHIRRIRTYVVNKATNERIPINDQTYSTTDGLPDAINNKLDSLETEDSNIDDPDSNTDNDDYSSFLFKEYNSDQCKRDAYDRFKKVTSQDAKQIAYRSVLDTSEMRSNMLATIKNAIDNVKASRTFNDVDQSLRTVSYSLKVGLKQTVSDLVIKVIPLAKDFLKTTENLKELYQKGPQSTRKMLTNILENESTVPESAKDILRLISPQFDVDELINNIFEKPCNAKSLKEKKVKAQRKLIDLSKHMDTAISNIDCFVLSAMSTIGIGADTLKMLKSGKVIMSDKHPRAKTLRDAVGIIKAGKKIRNNDDSFTPTLTPSDGTTESDEDDDDEDPDQVAQKNEEFLKTVPDLDDNILIPKKVPNKRQSLGVIVVHPDKQIEYKEVTDTSQLKKFVGDQTKKYKLQSKNKHPKFLKLNSKQLIDAMVADVKKKAERNGMTKKEMVDEIIKNLNST